MPTARGPRQPSEHFVVDEREGAWTAAARLGIDLSPLLPAAERARRKQLQAELQALLDAPLIPGKPQD